MSSRTKRMRRWAREKQSTDFKEAAGSLLRSFKGEHGEKMVCVSEFEGK